MVTPAFRVFLICLLALSGATTLPAKDFAAYRAGDIANEDISTPVALDVINAGATAALKSAQALKTPAIFRDYSDTTNAMANEFLAAFNAAHSNFLAAMQETFHSPALDETNIASPDFGYFITAFNIKNKNFPVPTNLATIWAHGDTGLALQTKWLAVLEQMSHRPIRPDELPADFVIGEIVRLVPPDSPGEKLPSGDAPERGKLITESSMTTISHLRVLFRRRFSTDEQPLARILGEFLKPNCLPEAALTQAARDRAVRQLVVADHYDAGQIIIRRGAAVDEKIRAALDQLNEKLMPGLLNQQIAAERDRAQRVSEQAQREHAQALESSNLAETAQDEVTRMHNQAVIVQNQAEKIRQRNQWLSGALVAVSIITLAALSQLLRPARRGAAPPARSRDLLAENAVNADARARISPADAEVLAPYLMQAVKDAVIQGLAAQRGELLQGQQIATAEITGLVRRLDELQAPMYVRFQTYEKRIEELQNDLSIRSAENRELLKLKIEMIRRQLETERAREPVESDWGTTLS